MNYYILETIEGDPLNKRVYKAENASQAYRLWLDSPVNRSIVREVILEVIEK